MFSAIEPWLPKPENRQHTGGAVDRAGTREVTLWISTPTHSFAANGATGEPQKSSTRVPCGGFMRAAHSLQTIDAKFTSKQVLAAPNQDWAIDFASDVADSGQRLHVLSVVDAFTRECLALESDTSMPSRRVTRVLQRIIEQRGAPQFLRSDNGPSVCSRHYLAWCTERSISTIHIQPGKPTQNGHVESFHGRLRDECLNASWFWNLWDARRKIANWRIEYNHRRPHSSLRYRTPEEFARDWATAASRSATEIPLRRNRVKAKPSGACGGLDSALAPWSGQLSKSRCSDLCLYNLMGGRRGHITRQREPVGFHFSLWT